MCWLHRISLTLLTCFFTHMISECKRLVRGCMNVFVLGHVHYNLFVAPRSSSLLESGGLLGIWNRATAGQWQQGTSSIGCDIPKITHRSFPEDGAMKAASKKDFELQSHSRCRVSSFYKYLCVHVQIR